MKKVILVLFIAVMAIININVKTTKDVNNNNAISAVEVTTNSAYATQKWLECSMNGKSCNTVYSGYCVGVCLCHAEDGSIWEITVSWC